MRLCMEEASLRSTHRECVDRDRAREGWCTEDECMKNKPPLCEVSPLASHTGYVKQCGANDLNDFLTIHIS